MSTPASAASSSVLRSRASIIALATLAAACSVYYLYRAADDTLDDHDSESDPEVNENATSLHRSNAVHGRRRSRRRSSAPAAVVTLEDEDTPAILHQGQGLADGETLLDDAEFLDDFSFAEVPEAIETQRAGQSIVQLLFRVSEDATRRDAYVHRGCACNACGVVPIKGIRYHCANCADYDLCEGCESQELHTKTHIFYKVRVPAPSHVSRKIQPVWYSGDPDASLRSLPRELMTRLSRDTGFERPQLDAYWEQWTFMANSLWREDPDGLGLAMDRATFERCLVPSGAWRSSAPGLIYDRMFAFYDTNKDSLIGFREFLNGIAYRRKKDKWARIFAGYDINDDGYVERKDFLRIFRSYYVLYREMHRDVLEGTEAQQLSSTDVNRLVHSRQPLSSAFGQDGHYPNVPHRDPIGKGQDSHGDVFIVDEGGVTLPSHDDSAGREDIFRRGLWIPGRNPFPFTEDTAVYWETLLNPPAIVDEMPIILEQLTRIRSASMDHESGGDSEFGDGYGDSQPYVSSVWPPRFVEIIADDIDTVLGPGYDIFRVPDNRRHAVTAQAVRRELARREIRNRWKRRQFYTDEEEGVSQPVDWDEAEDALARHLNGESSKSDSEPRVPGRSQSSSKERFEEFDGVDLRSDPTISSRSFPEPWSSLEISEAEKDAGKEILFQVAQQSFVELLDHLFKAKEDLAEQAMLGKERREMCRKLFKLPEYDLYFRKRAMDEASGKAHPSKHTGKRQSTRGSEVRGYDVVMNYEIGSDYLPDGEEYDPERVFDHGALSTSWEIDIEAPAMAAGQASQARETREEEAIRSAPDTIEMQEALRSTIASRVTATVAQRQQNETANGGAERASALTATREGAFAERAGLLNSRIMEEIDQPAAARLQSLLGQLQGTPHIDPLAEAGPSGGVSGVPTGDGAVGLDALEETYTDLASASLVEASAAGHGARDPTMPQFRPNAVAADRGHAEEEGDAMQEWERAEGAALDAMAGTTGSGAAAAPTQPASMSTTGLAPAPLSAAAAAAQKRLAAAAALDPPPSIHSLSERERRELYEHWQMEAAVAEAEQRRGWGRLSLPEFEAIIKERGAKGGRMGRSGSIGGGRARDNRKGVEMDYLGSWIEFCIP